MGIVSLINAFDVEKVVIGGGVSQVGEPLFNAVRTYVKKYALSPVGRETVIVPAKLNQDAGFIGAAALIHLNGFNNLKNQ
jgi:glucokinase